MKRNVGFWAELKGVPTEIQEVRSIMDSAKSSRCKYCGSDNVVKYGRYHNVQRWWCKECRRKFADNKAAPGLKTPQYQIALAVSMYYEGLGLKAIHQNLQQIYNSYPSNSSIYHWVDRIAKQIITADKKYKPKVSEVWVADETILTIGGQIVFCWDIIDARTRFLLASHLSRQSSAKAAKILLAKAVRKAGILPKLVIASLIADYFNGLEIAQSTETRRIVARNLHSSIAFQYLDSIHNSLAPRTKLMNSYKTIENMKILLRKWPGHYNYFRPHEVTFGNTPAQKAGIEYPLKVKIR
jgi:putative transposase